MAGSRWPGAGDVEQRRGEFAPFAVRQRRRVGGEDLDGHVVGPRLQMLADSATDHLGIAMGDDRVNQSATRSTCARTTSSSSSSASRWQPPAATTPTTTRPFGCSG
ncbi:hypothetical protein CcI49_09560 [Frankia sp. CcI49]|nr:hypothetical protein CcI49_09560 [Frankia sp. CcI49]